jgi:hypothetical protein
MESINNDFENIINIRDNNYSIIKDIDLKLNSLNFIYINMVKTHKEFNYIFGLDSFHFQNKLIELELKNMRGISVMVDNQIYCEYYKFYKIVHEYVKNEIKDTRIQEKVLHKNIYPIYKDLEPLQNYEFSVTIELRQNIINTINILISFMKENEAELNKDKIKSDMGINIGNLVNSHKFKIAILNERIQLFMNYIETFNNHHTKYLNRIYIKNKIMHCIVNEDIRLKNINKKGSYSDINTGNGIEIMNDQEDEKNNMLDELIKFMG